MKQGLASPIAASTSFGNDVTDFTAYEQNRVFDYMPGFVGILRGPEHRYEYVNEAYREISGPREFIGRTVREVFPELTGQGFYELLDRVYATGEPYAAHSIPLSLHRDDGKRFIDFLYNPIRDTHGNITGIFVGGYDPRKHTGRSSVGARWRSSATGCKRLQM